MLRSWLVLLSCTLLLAACGTLGKTSYLERAEAAIADRNWEMAYRFLEDGYTTENVANRERALSLVKKYPALLIGGAETFSIPKLVRSIESNGLVAGPRHELNRITMYRVVASPEAVALAERNVADALTEVKRAREGADFDKAEDRARIDAMNKRWTEAASAAKVTCSDALECSKVFALTQIFIVEKSQLKIQSANETIIQTFNPVEPSHIGVRATKIPRGGTTAVVELSLSCGLPKVPKDIFNCRTTSTTIYEEFPLYIKRMLIN